MSDSEEKTITVKIPKIALQSDWDEIEYKLAHLILEHIIHCNNGWWFKEEGKPWPEDCITHHVNCNDVFAWGCADSEDITHSEVNDLYEMYKKDPDWGSAAWCIKKRKEMPQEPVEKMMRKEGIWDLDELIKDSKK